MFAGRVSASFVRNLLIFGVVTFLTVSRVIREANALRGERPVVVVAVVLLLVIAVVFVFVVIDQQNRRSALRIESLLAISPSATIFSIAYFSSVRAQVAQLQASSDPVQPPRGFSFVTPTVTVDAAGIALWRADIIPQPILVLPWTRVSAVSADRLLEGIRYYPAIAISVLEPARTGHGETAQRSTGTFLLPVLQPHSSLRRAAPDTVADLVTAMNGMLRPTP